MGNDTDYWHLGEDCLLYLCVNKVFQVISIRISCSLMPIGVVFPVGIIAGLLFFEELLNRLGVGECQTEGCKGVSH